VANRNSQPHPSEFGNPESKSRKEFLPHQHVVALEAQNIAVIGHVSP
jgi:hypothetical protein